MDWKDIASPLISGASGLVGALVGSGVSAWTARYTHKERLIADHALAKKRFEFDCDLAQRKFDLDRKLVVWRTRFELAEKLLVAAYEARDALGMARHRVTLKGEGTTRTAEDGENPDLTKARNTAFIPIERLTRHSKAFATLQTALDSVTAHLGPNAASPIAEILNDHRAITNSAGLLIEHAEWNEDRSGRESLKVFREELWGEKGVEQANKVNDAVAKLEEICRPILQATAPV